MGANVSRIQLHEYRGAKTADCAESGASLQGADSGTDAPEVGDEHRTDGRRTGSLFTRLDRLFRKMRNTLDAAKPCGMDQAQIAVCDLEAVEARYGAFRRATETGRKYATRCENSGQRPRAVAPCEQQDPRDCAAQCLPRLAWDSEIDWRPIAQPAEPPYAGPHVRWCDRESGRPLGLLMVTHDALAGAPQMAEEPRIRLVLRTWSALQPYLLL